MAPPAPATVPVVGRAPERQVLRAALGGAVDGTGAVVLVAGPAGIGKTRLLEQAATDAAAAGVPVAWGRCPSEQGVPPLWPWQRVLAAAGAPPVAAPAGAGFPATPDDTAAVKVLVASSVTDALAAAAAPAGLVVVLEDLHWADRASLDLLRHLAADVRRSRLLVVASTREVSGSLPAALADLVPLPGVELLPLGPLSVAGVAAYLSAAQGRAVGTEVVALVHERSGGNPLYVRTLARVLGPDLDLPLPGGGDLEQRLAGSSEVRSLVRSILRPLDPDVVDLLRVASLLGEEIQPALLADVAERPQGVVEVLLDAAASEGLLGQVPGGTGRRRFAHALVRDGVLADVPATTRSRWHARAATVLEAAAAGRPELVDEVAFHWLRGAQGPDQHRLAVRWARQAAERSAAYAPEQAAQLLASARGAAARAGLDPSEHAELLVDLADAEYRAGAMAASLEHCQQASRLAEVATRPDLLAAAALVLRGIGHTDTAAVLAELCERALRAGPHPAPTTARLLAQRALALAELGQVEQGRRLAVEALAAAEACRDATALLLAVHARVDTLDCLSDPEERRSLADRALAAATDGRQPLTRLWALLWRLDADYQAGDPRAVAETIVRLESLITSLPLPLARWHLLRVRAAHAALTGDLPRARGWNDEAEHVDLQDPAAYGMSSAFRATLAMLTGDPADLGEHWFAVTEHAPDLPVLDATKGGVLLLLGRTDEAEALYRKVLPLAPALPRDGRWSGTLDALVALAEGLSDLDGARVLHELCVAAAPWSGGPAAGNMWASGSGWRRVGRTATVLGRHDEAVAAFRRALHDDVRMGARPFAALNRLGLAELLVDDDPVQARSCAKQAATEARTLGLPGPLRRADQLLHRLLVERVDPLTPREREVAALVARSSSNREIAERLVLSERTVESHVRNILSKLGLTRRTQIVRWALTDAGHGAASSADAV